MVTEAMTELVDVTKQLKGEAADCVRAVIREAMQLLAACP